MSGSAPVEISGWGPCSKVKGRSLLRSVGGSL